MHFQTLRASRIPSHGGKRNRKKETSNIEFFVHFLIVGRNLSKKLMSKKVGVTDLLKQQNPDEIVILARSAILFPYKSSSECVRSMNDVAPL